MVPPAITDVETGEDYIHVQYRDPDDFGPIRTPDWAAEVAQSVIEGAEVRTGDLKGDDEWVVQSVLVPEHVGPDRATELAEQIAEKLESEADGS